FLQGRIGTDGLPTSEATHERKPFTCCCRVQLVVPSTCSVSVAIWQRCIGPLRVYRDHKARNLPAICDFISPFIPQPDSSGFAQSVERTLKWRSEMNIPLVRSRIC